MKRLLRWAVCGLIVMILLLVAGVLAIDPLAKSMLESSIRTELGMDVKIGKLSVGLLSPTFRIEDFTLYNTSEFGGSPFIKMPELFIEYDRAKLNQQQLHLKILRLNVAEISIIQDKRGRYNVNAFNKSSSEKKKSKVQFAGIDTLNLTIQTMRFNSLENPAEARQVNFDIKDQQFRDIKSEKDFQAIVIFLAAKGGAGLFNLITPSKARDAAHP